MRRPVAVWLVAILALTAGCAGLVGDTSDAGTVTPVSVPERPTPVAPGVIPATDEEPSQVDAGALGYANDQLREEHPFRWTRTVTIDGRNGALRIEREQTRAPDGRVNATFDTSTSGTFSVAVRESGLYSDGSVFWTRTVLADGTVAGGDPQPSPPRFHETGLRLVDQLLQAGPFTVARVEDGRVTLRSQSRLRLDGVLVPLPLDDPHNATATLTVREDGLVVGTSLSYSARFGDRAVTVDIRQGVDRLGTATVTRPDWVNDSATTATTSTAP